MDSSGWKVEGEDEICVIQAAKLLIVVALDRIYAACKQQSFTSPGLSPGFWRESSRNISG